MTRFLSLLLLLASLPAAAQPWPEPGDGFDWQAVGDRPVKSKHIAFDSQGQLWSASTSIGGNAARLSDPGDPTAEWFVSGSTRSPTRVLALGQDTVLIGEGVMHRTFDGGQTWDYVDTPCSVQSGGAMFEVPAGTPPGPWGETSGVLFAGRTGLCRSDDRGATWTTVPQSETSQFALRIADALVLPAGHAHAGRLVVATSDGVWLSDESRETLSLRRADGPTMSNPEHLALLPSGRLIATGVDTPLPTRRVRVSDDGGESWRDTAALLEVSDGGIPGSYPMAVIGPGTAVAVSGRGLVYRTDDAGESWAVVGRVPITDGALTARHALIGPQGRLYVAVTRAGPEATDAWVWRTALPITVADETVPAERGAAGVTVSPNPSRGMVMARIASASPPAFAGAGSAAVRVEVWDATGRRVAVLHEGASVGDLSLDVDTSGFAVGVYRVVVTSGGERAQAAFTVAR